MRSSRPRLLSALLVCGAALVLMPSSAAAKQTMPVVDSAWAALWAAVLQPAASPNGANDWNCKPTKERPRPVILLHGTYANMSANFSNFALPLKRQGYCVFARNYGSYPYGLGVFPAIKGLASIRSSSRELRDYVNRVLRETGAKQVDLVGYSQGGLVARAYLKWDGGTNPADPSQNKVNQLIGLASANQGGTAWGLTDWVRWFQKWKQVRDIWGPSSVDLTEGSPFLRDVNAGSQTEPGVKYTMIAAGLDQISVPYSKSFLTPGPDASVKNILVQDGCPRDLSDHFTLPFSKRTHGLVLKALDPSYPDAKIPCNLHLPL
ncbi:MAG: alpha/beta fold hydrolase [Solirubrobacteraceae bacterium]|nr:alpha/beta fold hydrolase [Solirubrobacteraceae bacterium]